MYVIKIMLFLYIIILLMVVDFVEIFNEIIFCNDI